MLAIQGLNSNAGNSRFLTGAGADGLAWRARCRPTQLHYFAVSDGQAARTGLGTTTAIVDVAHSPQVPTVDDALLVTGSVVSTAGEVPPVALHYRVMYDSETSVPMWDDGQHGDGAAGDGVYGATIPAGVAAPGQMIRYRITAGATAADMARCRSFPTHSIRPSTSAPWSKIRPSNRICRSSTCSWKIRRRRKRRRDARLTVFRRPVLRQHRDRSHRSSHRPHGSEEEPRCLLRPRSLV